MPQFDESKHPRAEDGKFTEKGNGTATSKKEKEYNPRGSSLKAGDSISYKEDTKYGGERRKGKIASIDKDTITTTDGKKINKFNAFKEEEKKKPDQEKRTEAPEELWDAVCSNDIEKVKEYYENGGKSNLKHNQFNQDNSLIMGALRNGNMEMVKLLEQNGETILPEEKLDYELSMKNKANTNKEEDKSPKETAPSKTYETGNIGYHKGYGIDYNVYGGGEFSVQVDGDDVMFKTEQEAKDFINDLVKNPEYQIPNYEDEDVEVDLDYERGYGVIPDPEEEPEEYKKYMDAYKKWKENGGSFETPEQPKAQPQESNAVKKLKGLGLNQSEIDEIIAELTGKKGSKLPF